jgi:hypothetical protein
MITRVLVRTADTPPLEHACHLAGFGMTICGNCNKVLRSIAIGTRCVGCGAAVVSVERVGDRFEGEAA